MTFPLNAYFNNAVACPPVSSCDCPSEPCGTPGNGLGAFTTGQNPFPAVAVAALQPFRAVQIVAGGINYASIDDTTSQVNAIGVIGVGASSGSQSSICWGGPITNTINGTGGWNWALGTPVYLSTNGNLTQTPPPANSGFTRVIGIPLSANTLFVLSPADHSQGNPTDLFVAGSTATAYVNGSTWSSGTISVDVSLVLVGGSFEGQAMTVAIEASGGNRNVTLNPALFIIPSSSSLTSPVTVLSGTETVFGLRYKATANKWRVIAAVAGY